MANTLGETAVHSKDNLLEIESMALVSTPVPMVQSMKVIGPIIRNPDTESSPNQTVESMREISLMIKKKDMVSKIGETAVSTKVNGLKMRGMELATVPVPMVKCAKVCGRMANESNG